MTKVPLVDHDQSDLSHQIATELKTIAGLEIEDTFLQDGMPHAMTEGQARQQLDARRRAITLLIPQGFSESVMAGRPTAFILLQNPGEQLTLGIVRGLLTSFADRLSLQITAARAALMPSQGQANPEETVQHALRGSRELWETPAIGVRVQDATGMAGRDINVFQQNVPGYAVMFALFTMMGGGKALLEERELGTLRRLRAAPVSKASILVGKLVTNFFTAFMEVVVFFAFGHVVFGMELGNSLLGLAMLASAVALAATSLGICIAALVKTQAQLSYASVLTVLTMSSLGGSWWPLEIMPAFMRTLGHLITINAWAMDGFKDLFWYGRGVSDILPEVGALLVISAMAFRIGFWRFRFD